MKQWMECFVLLFENRLWYICKHSVSVYLTCSWRCLMFPRLTCSACSRSCLGHPCALRTPFSRPPARLLIDCTTSLSQGCPQASRTHPLVCTGWTASAWNSLCLSLSWDSPYLVTDRCGSIDTSVPSLLAVTVSRYGFASSPRASSCDEFQPLAVVAGLTLLTGTESPVPLLQGPCSSQMHCVRLNPNQGVFLQKTQLRLRLSLRFNFFAGG